MAIPRAFPDYIVDSIAGPIVNGLLATSAMPSWVVNPLNPPDLMFDFVDNLAWIKTTGGTVSASSLLTVVRAAPAAWVNDSAGNWTSVNSNLPRLSNLGLLIEEARTNSVLQSQAFNTTWAVSASTITPNVDTAPDGTLTADALIESSTNAEHLVQQTVAGLSVTVPYGISLLAKPGAGATGRFINIELFDATVTANFTTVTVDTLNGTASAILNSGESANSSVTTQAAANGYYWIKLITTPAVTANTGILYRIRRANALSTAAGAVSYLGDGTSSTFVWQAGLEAGSSVTSIIPTTTVAVTRAGDYIRIPTAEGQISMAANTFYWEHTPISITGPGTGLLGGAANALAFTNVEYVAVDATGHIAGSAVGATGAASPTIAAPLNVGNNKAASRYALGANNFIVALNGTTGSATGGTVAPTTPGNIVTIGSAPWNAGSNFQSGFYPKGAFWYTQSVPNAQLVTMTT